MTTKTIEELAEIFNKFEAYICAMRVHGVMSDSEAEKIRIRMDKIAIKNGLNTPRNNYGRT